MATPDSILRTPLVPPDSAVLTALADPSMDLVILSARAKELRRQHWDALHAEVLADINEITGREICLRLCAVADAIVIALFRRALVAAGAPPDWSTIVGLFSLGGYGRLELCPASDLDLLVLVHGRRNPDWVSRANQAFQTALWDAGFKVGAALRSVEGLQVLLAADFVTGTAILEQRPLLAEDAAVAAMAAVLARFRKKRRRPFLAYKVAELEERRRRAGSSAYVLEANLKSGPGGLRDVQFLRNVVDVISGSRALTGMFDLGGISWEEVQQVQVANDRQLLIRCLQHFHHGHAHDALTLTDQTRLAGQLGYVDENLPLKAVEYLMQDIYGGIGQVVETVVYVIARLRALGHLGRKRLLITTRKQLAPGVVAVDGRVYLTDDARWQADDVVAVLFDLARQAQSRGLRFSHELQRQIRDHLGLFGHACRLDPTCTDSFRAILGRVGRVAPQLRDLHAAGLLGHYLPEFGRITRLMQFNAYHHYTVDEHTLIAIDRLDAIARDEEAEAPASLPVLLKSLPRPDLLVLALLLHDTGKFLGDGHVRRGALMVHGVAERLGLDEDEEDQVFFLVGQHLVLSDASRSRDIHDPDFLHRLAVTVGTRERLDALLLLTWVDARSVGPHPLADWQVSLLLEVHAAVAETLAHGAPAWRGKVEERMLAALVAAGIAVDAGKVFLDRMPDDYGYFIEAGAVVADHGAFVASRKDPDHFGFRRHAEGDSTRLALAMPDRLHLLCDVTAVLFGHGLDVVESRIWDSSDGVAMENIRVQPLVPGKWEGAEAWNRLAADLRACARGEVDHRRQLERRGQVMVFRKVPDSGHRGIDISCDNEISDRSTILDIRAMDFHGILSLITRVIADAGCNVDYACIGAQGDIAVDVFHLSRDGAKLSASDCAALEAALRASFLAHVPS